VQTRKGREMSVIISLLDALSLAFGMFWEILWALVLGFVLSAAVQAVVSKAEMTRLLPDDSARSLGIACGLGAASSSCSYAAVALARSIFRKGADFTAAMVFEFASTNLVIELGIIMAILLGWEFTLGEFVGGPIMIVLLVLLFRAFLGPRLLDAARRRADRGLVGSMEGHAEMDMSVTEGPFFKRLTSPRRLYGHKPLLRDGLGRHLEGHSRRPVDRWDPWGLGSALFLAGLLPRGESDSRGDLGASGGTAGRGALVRVLHR
jgi:hypothetical protein